jgi:hypothetical protein
MTGVESVMKSTIYTLSLAVMLFAACKSEKTVQVTDSVSEVASNAAEAVKDKLDIGTPTGPGPTREEMERERFNAEWQQLESFRQAAAKRQADAAKAPAPAPATATGGPKFVALQPNQKSAETLKGMNPAAVNDAAVTVPISGDVQGPSVLRAQVLLDRNRYSVAAIDGRWGKNSAIAVYWFQRSKGLPTTGEIDEQTYRALLDGAGALPLMREYSVTAEDMKGPFTAIPEDVYDQEKLDCLCYETPLEYLSEKFHVTQEFLQSLNPNVKAESIAAGTKLWVPNVRETVTEGVGKDIQKIVVSVKGNYLHGLDAAGNIVFHAATTVGSKYDPSPDETVKLVKTAFDPHFHYQPKLFADVSDDKPEANLQPGPNSPVGVVWMALSKPHFGIHGTGDPESIGYASSHGCVRLPNWDAREVANRTPEGIQVAFVDTRSSAAANAVKQQQSEGSPQ